MRRAITLIAILVTTTVLTFGNDKPNIIFILSDDQAWTDYGFMGHPDIKTPHLDQLAGESLLFRRGYLAAPICRPSLASMVTGLHPFDHGVTGNDVRGNENREELDIPLREAFYNNPGFIEMLTDNGYLAHQSGKWWEGSYQDGGFTHGMKSDPTTRHGKGKPLTIGRETLEPVTDFIDLAVDQDKPFFVWYGVFLPHTPHNPPERLLSKYTKEGRAKDVAKYYAMCEWMDETCGDLIGYLDEKNIRDNTIIVYICDNGWAARSTRADDPHQKAWKGYALRTKASPFDGGIRTPVMISWPGKVKPCDDPNLAHSLDIFPTIMAAAGLEAPSNLPGINLLDKKARNDREIVFGSVHASHNISIGNPDETLQYLWGVEGDWKLIIRYHGKDLTRYKQTHSWDKEPVRLYNLRDDPHEKNEISKQYPEKVQELRKKIKAWHPVKNLPATEKVEPEKPNILLIAVDDLNDWVGCMGGHPQTKTPNIDKLAEMGTLFTNAHCQATVCRPSRISLMTSLYPSTTGLYFLNPKRDQSPEAMKNTVMPERYVDEGYYVSAAGKLFHSGENKIFFPKYGGTMGGFGPLPEEKLTGMPGTKLWDWGIYPDVDEKMPDHKIANWVVEEIKQNHEKPFFIGAGFYRPHVPQYAPKKWFDLYPEESVKLPEMIENDLDDIPGYGINLTRLKHIAPTMDWVIQNNEWKPLVRSYLACVSFVDHQIGKLLDAIEASPHKDNTYIVLFSDHGFHQGEKERWAKRSPWADGTRVPLIIAGPGIEKHQVCNKPVELLDIYPTLLELTGMKADPAHEGQSLVPLLKDYDARWPHIARTELGKGNCAISSERYRFISYLDGSEEFYDLRNDPNEWYNLINEKSLQKEIEKHRKQLPVEMADILGSGSTGHKAYKASGELIKK